MKITSVTAMAAIIFLLILPCFSGCLYQVSGSGNLVTEQFDYTDFANIEVSNVFEVEISQSDTYSIDITADDNIMEYVTIDRSGDTLRVGLKIGYSYRSITAVAKIDMPDIKQFVLSGASGAIINDFASAGNVNIDVSGASSLTLSGLSCADIGIEVSGASNLNGNLNAAEAVFNISGASRLSLTGLGQDLKATVSGASNMDLDSFVVDNLDINVSGASTAVVNTEGTLDADVSGASSLQYIGNPTLGDISVSGASDLEKK